MLGVSDLTLGLILGAGAPTLVWATRLFWLVNETHKMHVKAGGAKGFSTIETNKLHREHIDLTEKASSDFTNTIKRLDYTIAELSHFIQWLIKDRSGHEAPPYVRKKG